ncbi:hypothetical protein [Streptomyces sp. NPDC057249]|uniref:hypothetical protein n=1 Tax=Streptomyces sp. NPDC057249 TaxID=3346067 RepID=UPI00363DEAD2
MSSLVLLVALLLVLVVVQGLGALAYIAHRHPQTATPIGLVLCGAGVLATVVVPIVVR